VLQRHTNAHTTLLLSGTMPLTVAQTAAFFEQDAQMSIPHATVIQLQQEGITIINNHIPLIRVHSRGLL
jgi:hypothetical protein